MLQALTKYRIDGNNITLDRKELTRLADFAHDESRREELSMDNRFFLAGYSDALTDILALFNNK